MKDIVLFQSSATRKRAARHLQTLELIHKTEKPPPELLHDRPRKLRWKTALKVAVAFEVVLLLVGIIGAIWMISLATRLYYDMTEDIRKSNEKMRRYAKQVADPEKKAKAKKAVREGEEVQRKWRLLAVAMIAKVLLACLVGPITHAVISWFEHARPEFLLLREGILV